MLLILQLRSARVLPGGQGNAAELRESEKPRPGPSLQPLQQCSHRVVSVLLRSYPLVFLRRGRRRSSTTESRSWCSPSQRMPPHRRGRPFGRLPSASPTRSPSPPTTPPRCSPPPLLLPFKTSAGGSCLCRWLPLCTAVQTDTLGSVYAVLKRNSMHETLSLPDHQAALHIYIFGICIFGSEASC